MTELFLPEADEEFREAARYYENECPGLGLTFITTVHKAISWIMENPMAATPVGSGCEEGLIPYERSKDEATDVAEERRLFYVGLTRAKEKLFLTHAKKRLLFGSRLTPIPSPFLEDIERELKQHESPFSGEGRADVQLSLFK